MSKVDGTQALPEDEYLAREELLELHGILTGELNRILGNTQEAVASLTTEEESESDTLDIAVNASNREFMLRLADRERRQLGKIREALGRMSEGEYGVCQSCGAPITYGRLLARPFASQCIDCKTEAEQLNRRVSAF